MSENIDAKTVKQLRDQTGVGMMEAKKALQESKGDLEKAIDQLRKQGQAKAAKKSEREAQEGLIEAYIHGEGRIGVLLELNCETDFVARNDDFKNFAHELALHIAASAPQYVSREDVPEDVVAKEKEIFMEAAKNEGKPEDMLEKIVQGKLEKFYQEVCLLEQAYVRDQDKTIQDLITEKIAVLGENIQVGRFTRFAIGE